MISRSIVSNCLIMFVILNGCKVKDLDGNKYKKVKIGNQVWLSPNLEVTKFNDKTPIKEVKDNSEWSNLSAPGLSWYNNTRGTRLGALYNAQVVSNAKNVCPEGFRVPTMDDWQVLINQYSTVKEAAKALMLNDLKYWGNLYGATNSSGFNAVGNGLRIRAGRFTNIKKQALWWVKNSLNDNKVFSINSGQAGEGVVPTGVGVAIRCLKNTR